MKIREDKLTAAEKGSATAYALCRGGRIRWRRG